MNNWQNNTCVLLSDLHDDHEIALVENSLRDSEFYDGEHPFKVFNGDNSIGVFLRGGGYWQHISGDELITRTQALKLAGVEL